MIKYVEAPDVKELLDHIVNKLDFSYINKDNVICFRSKGTSSKRVMARCWAFPKIWQLALKTRAHYIIEVVSEKYDGLSQHEKEKVLIHELLHIPKCFGGGLKPHKGWITNSIIEKLHKLLKED